MARQWLRGRSRHTGRATGWGVLDQGLSSVTNFAVGVVVARYSDPREFGAFSLAFAFYLVLLGACRSLSSDPLVVRFSAEEPSAQHRAGRAATGTAAVIGLVVGVIVLMAGQLTGQPQRGVLTALALSLPALLVQDAVRYVLFAGARQRAAAANDAVWGGLQLVAMAVLVASHHATAATLTGAWGVGAAIAALLGVAQSRVRPSLRACRAWVRDHADLGLPFLGEFIATTGTLQLTLFGAAAVADITAVGALRAATLLLGPLTVLFLGITVVALPEAVRVRKRSPHALVTTVARLGVVLPVVTLAWAGVVLLLPTSLGRALLGSNWQSGRDVLVPMAVMTAGVASTMAAVVGLRALEAGRQSLRARLLTVPVILVGGIAGAALADGYGAAVGLAIAYWFDAGVAWLALRGVLARQSPSPVGEADAVRLT